MGDSFPNDMVKSTILYGTENWTLADVLGPPLSVYQNPPRCYILYSYLYNAREGKVGQLFELFLKLS